MNNNMANIISFLGEHETVQLAGFLSGMAWNCFGIVDDGTDNGAIHVCIHPIGSLIGGTIEGSVVMFGVSIVEKILPKTMHALIPVCLGISVLSTVGKVFFGTNRNKKNNNAVQSTKDE